MHSIAQLNIEAETISLPKGLTTPFGCGVQRAFVPDCAQQPDGLYAKTLDASATVLGIIAGICRYWWFFRFQRRIMCPRIGYKRFVYGVWGTRVLFIFGWRLVR